MWKDYLSFSRQEQKGIILLGVVIFLLLLYRFIAPLIFSSNQIVVIKDDTLFTHFNQPQLVNPSSISKEVTIPYFDPNEVTQEFLMEIGLNKRIANNWINYIEKGGSFNNVSDVKKVYGVDSLLYSSLHRYMLISEKNEESKVFKTGVEDNNYRPFFIDLNNLSEQGIINLGWDNSMIDTVKSWSKKYWVSQRYEIQTLKKWNHDSLRILKMNLVPRVVSHTKNSHFILEMNSADTSQWELLNGVGPVLSKRIVAYRKKLGGFSSPDQLIEVYGLSPLLVSEIKPFLVVDSLKIKVLDINKASLRQLKEHPYIGFYKAQAIIDERKKKGKFLNTKELLELSLFNDGKWERINPYLTAK